MEEIDIEKILDMFEDDYVIPASKMERPQSALDREMFEDFNKRNPQADGGRIPFAKAKSVQKLGPRDKIDQLGVGEKILEEYSEGAGTIELGKKYGVSRDTVNRYIKKFNPNLIRKSPPKVNQYNFDYSIIDKIKEDSKTMSRKEILKKYEGKISKKKLDSLKLIFGKVEESGRPRVLPGERSPKQVKRVNRIKNAQGFDVSGTFAKNFHHVFPIGGLSELSAQDVMILDKKFNETLGGFNLQLNDIADEIGSMDLSDPNALKKLNDLNAKSKDLVNKAKAKLPKELQNAIGYIEYNPVFDSNGTIVELSQIKKGVDKPMGSLPAEFGTKKFKDYTPEEIKKFKTRVKQLALQAGDEGTMFAANVIPKKLLTKSLGDMAMSLGSPTALIGLNAYLGVDPRESLDRAILGAEAALAPSGIKALTSRLANIKNPTVRKGIETLAGLRLPGVFTPANVMRAARFASPVGIATLAGEGLYQLGKLGYKEQQKINEMRENDPEAYQRYLAEQQELMDVSA